MGTDVSHPSRTSVADRFAAAFTTHDVEQVVEVFAADVRYHDLFYGVHDGHSGLRALFRRMYAEGSRHEWTMESVVVGPDVTIGEWHFEFTVSDAVPSGAGRTLRFDGVSVFATRDGLCHAYREYFDRTAVLLAVGIAPETAARIAAARSTVERTTGP